MQLRPYPLRALIFLAVDYKTKQIAFERLGTTSAYELRGDLMYADELSKYANDEAARFHLYTALARSTRIYSLIRPLHHESLPHCLDKVMAALEETA